MVSWPQIKKSGPFEKKSLSRLSKSCPFNDARISYRRSKARGRSSKEDPKINQVYLFRWQSRESINFLFILLLGWNCGEIK